MRRRVGFIMLALIAAAACEDSELGGDVLVCFSIEDCPAESMCFLGNCVDPGFRITTVYAELTPPNDSPWLAQQLPDAIDVGDDMIDIPLRAAVLYTGTVLTEGDPSGDSSLTGMLTVHRQGSIPGRDIVRQASVSSSGFSMQLLPDTYDVSFLPDLGNPPRPPKDFPPYDISGHTDQELRYPADNWLVTIRGRVRYTSATQGGNVEGAQVVGVARDAAGNELRSTAALTDIEGEFTISFPPGAQEFDITVGPGSNPLLPEATFPGLSITQAPDRIDDIILGLSPEVFWWNAAVRDKDDKAVLDATILFDGLVGQGRFQKVANSGSRGNLLSQLLPGDYTVTVAPQRAQPYAITSTQVAVPSSVEVVQLTVRDKVKLTGFVTSHNRQPVKGATVTLTLRDAPTRREFSTVAGGDGWYRVDVDPGSATEPAEYELTIETERQSGLPWFSEMIVVGESNVRHDVTLYPPSFAFGRVREPGGTPLADVIIAFYSKVLIWSDLPLLVGVVQTSEDGEFVLPVPTLASP